MAISLGALLGGASRAYTAHGEGQATGRKDALAEQALATKAAIDAQNQRLAQERLALALQEFERNSPDNKLDYDRRRLEQMYGIRNESEAERLRTAQEINSSAPGRSTRDALSARRLIEMQADSAVGAALTRVTTRIDGMQGRDLRDPNVRQQVRLHAQEIDPSIPGREIDAAIARILGRPLVPTGLERTLNFLNSGGMDGDPDAGITGSVPDLRFPNEP